MNERVRTSRDIELASEEAFFFERSLDLLSVLGLDGYFKRVNPQFVTTLGYSEAELLATPFLDFVHPDDHAATLAEMGQLKAGVPTLNFENRYRTREGSYRWLAWTASPQLERGVIYCVARDITQQKQTQVALRQSEERWQLALRGSNDGIWDWNVETNEVFFSARWKTMLGFAEAEIDNHLDEWAKRVHPDDREWVMQVIQDHFARKTPFYVSEHRVLCKDGSYKWILDRGQAIWDEAGNVVRMVGSHTDVTERRELESALKLANETLEQRVAERTAELEQINRNLKISEIRFRTAIDYIPDVFVIYDAQRRIQFINAAGLALTERPLQDFIGHMDEEVHPPEVTSAYLPLLQRTIETKSYQTGECTITLPNRDPYTIVVQYVPLLDERGAIEQILAITHDITQRKRSEENTRRSEQQVRRVLNSLFSFVGVMTPDGILTEANRTALNAAELRPEDVLGKPFEQTYWWSYAPEVQSQLRAAIARAAGGETVRYDAVVRVKNDQLITIDFTLVPTYDSFGRVEYLIPSGIDISERKRAEIALQQSQAQVQRQLAEIETIYQSAPIGLNVLDTDLRFIRINQRLAEINGISVADHIGRTVREVLPDIADVAEPLLQQILETGEPLLNVEILGETPAQPGVKRVWMENFLPLKSNDRVIGINTVCEEITERKQAEQALRESEQRFRQLAENIDEAAFWIRDLQQSQVVYISAAYERIWGRSATDLYADNREWLKAIHPEDRERVQTAFEEYGQASNFDQEYRIVRPDGTVCWIRDRAFPIRDQAGVAYRVVGMAEDITDRRQAEASLRQYAARMEFVLEAAQFGTWEVNLESQSYLAAPRSLKHDQIYGYATLQLDWSFERFVQHVHPDDRPLVEHSFRQSVTEYVNWDIECRIIRTDGEQRWVWISGSIYRDTSGKPTWLMGLIVDITDRKQAERRLRESGERLQLGMQVAGFALASVDYATNLVQLSPAAALLYGLPADQLVVTRDQIHDTFHPDDRAELMRVIQQVLDPQGAGWFASDHRVVGSHGEVKWLTVRKQVFFDRSGETPHPTHAILAALDITQRKQAEEALQESEDRLRMAIASAQLGIWDWNVLTENLKWDRGCKVMFGLPDDAEPSMEIFLGSIHPEDRDRVQASVQQTLNPASGGDFDIEYRVIGIRDRVERWLRSKGQVYFDANGTPLQFTGTVLDITTQKQVEAQRERLLQQEQTAREAAERANRMKDEFLAVLSHELRTPLNPILGWSKLLQSPRVTADKLHQGLTTIERNAKQQVQLIDDLLDISRIIRGKISLNFTTVNLAEPIVSALETVRLTAEAKSIQLSVSLDPTVGYIRGDSSRLQQVIWNLLSNAIKFTPQGGQVEVRLETIEVGGDRPDNSAAATCVQISVSDTGKGIQPDFLPHVFELFRQQDSSTTRTFGGLGLGLAIARQVVEAHGGTITAASAGEGQGATFIVRLPLNTTPSIDLPDSASDPPLNLEGLRILAVDDELDSLELLTVLLEREGATVVTASQAASALQLLAQSSFDLLISDIGMPEMDGFSLIRQIRNLPIDQNRDLLAIALTAYAGEVNRRQILAAGFQAHLVKPLDPQFLLETIASLVLDSSQNS